MSNPGNEEVVVIQPRLRPLLGLFFAGLVLLAFGGATFLDAFDDSASLKPTVSLVGLVFGSSLVTLAASVLCLTASYFMNPRPILSITADGITGVGGLTGTRMFIAWHEMAAVRQKGSDIVIDLKDPAAVMARAGWGRRILMRINQAFFGTPAAIPSLLVPMPTRALAEILENRRVQAVMK